MREAERCTDVTNSVVGEAVGPVLLAELTPPLMGWEGGKWSGYVAQRL